MFTDKEVAAVRSNRSKHKSKHSKTFRMQNMLQVSVLEWEMRTSKKLPQQQTLIAKETKPDGESMKDTRQGVHIQIDVAAKALFGVLL